MLFFLAHGRCDLTKKRSPYKKTTAKVLERKKTDKKIQKGFVVSSLKVDKILCAPAKHSRGTERTIKMDGTRFLSFFLVLSLSFSLSLSLSFNDILSPLFCVSMLRCGPRSSIFEYISPTEETISPFLIHCFHQNAHLTEGAVYHINPNEGLDEDELDELE